MGCFKILGIYLFAPEWFVLVWISLPGWSVYLLEILHERKYNWKMTSIVCLNMQPISFLGIRKCSQASQMCCCNRHQVICELKIYICNVFLGHLVVSQPNEFLIKHDRFWNMKLSTKTMKLKTCIMQEIVLIVID